MPTCTAYMWDRGCIGQYGVQFWEQLRSGTLPRVPTHIFPLTEGQKKLTSIFGLGCFLSELKFWSSGWVLQVGKLVAWRKKSNEKKGLVVWGIYRRLYYTVIWGLL